MKDTWSSRSHSTAASHTSAQLGAMRSSSHTTCCCALAPWPPRAVSASIFAMSAVIAATQEESAPPLAARKKPHRCAERRSWSHSHTAPARESCSASVGSTHSSGALAAAATCAALAHSANPGTARRGYGASVAAARSSRCDSLRAEAVTATPKHGDASAAAAAGCSSTLATTVCTSRIVYCSPIATSTPCAHTIEPPSKYMRPPSQPSRLEYK
mmetsp:Transcript_6413/g.21050  ORF Transcript_6413/g.21050 Transcript_6413/m.21050 type:complete len:214 (+) Transcript_6413:665-1306(+)